MSEQPGDRSRGLLWFDISRIPEYSPIRRAELRLHLSYASGPTVGRSLLLHRLRRPWTPTLATWEQAGAALAWAEGGAGLAGADYEPEPSDLAALDPGGPLILDVTADLQAWQQGAANLGWLLRLSEGTSLLAQLASAEQQDATLRPALLITLDTGAAPFPPTPTPTPLPTPTPAGSGGAARFERALTPGWYAFSLPLIPANPALPAVLDSIGGSYDNVLWYDNSA